MKTFPPVWTPELKMEVCRISPLIFTTRIDSDDRYLMLEAYTLLKDKATTDKLTPGGWDAELSVCRETFCRLIEILAGLQHWDFLRKFLLEFRIKIAA